MKFTEAADKLKEIAGGKYHSLRYSLSSGNMIEPEACCSVYISGTDWISASTWDEAFRLLGIHMMPTKIEDLPEIGDCNDNR